MIITVSVIAIVYNESTYKRIRRIHSYPADESYYSAIQYLERRPNGKYAKEATDTLLKYYVTLPSYTIPTVNGKPWPMTRYDNNLIKIKNTKDQVAGSPAEPALDSLIRARIDEEYEKASKLNTEEGWKVFDSIVPEEYRGLHLRN